MAGSKPGERRGGRQKGTPNKLTRDVKEAVLQAFNAVGGAKYLAKQAEENPQAFMTLLGKVLPTQTQFTGEIAMKADPVDRPPRETREEWIARRNRELGTAALLGAAAGSAE